MPKPSPELHWSDNAEFWEQTYPFDFDQDRFTIAPDEVEGIVNLLALSPPANILDMCCGPGRHAIELARDGYRVTGVDVTASFLDLARNAATAADQSVEFVQADARTFKRTGAFDVVINLFNSFGYFKTDSEQTTLLENAYDALVPGGQILIETVNQSYMTAQPELSLTRRLNGMVLTEVTRVTPDGSTLTGYRTIQPRGKPKIKYDFSLKLYSQSRMRHMLAAARFTDTSIFGSLSGKPYTSDARHMVVIARRPWMLRAAI
jgi:SAM-dependent methyltransferase